MNIKEIFQLIFIRNCYKILMLILCLIGCVYQMFNLNVIYFSYETTTNVRYEAQSEPYLPAITICYDKRFQLTQDEFYVSKKNLIVVFTMSFTIQENFDNFAKTTN